ncbi:MAG TPA: PEP-utilizing enzyme, partial [Opitutaceae bacterium]
AVREGLAAVRATPAGPRLDEWLHRWGLRIIALDPAAPTIAEMPALVLELLRQPRSASQASTRAREAAIARARAALDERGRERFDTVLRVAARVHPQREENVLYTQSLPLGLVRRALLEAGRRLASRRVLHAADDVMFLEPDELRAALTTGLAGEGAPSRVRRRRAERAWVRAHPGPAFHGPAPVPPPSPRGLPAGLQRLLSALAWELALEETAALPAATDGALVGTGASPGRVTGRVRVIRSEEELVHFQQGEILVCPSTHSSWAVVFARAAALVTDHGGALAHPSIVAREYGIPAVVGTGCATAKLKTGQVVTVDGATGRVEVRTQSTVRS